MSRLVDLVLVLSVAAAAWWLLAGRNVPSEDVQAAGPRTSAATTTGTRLPALAESATLDPTATNAGSTPAGPLGPVQPDRFAWTVDDPKLARHPGLRLVTLAAGATQPVPLSWEATADGAGGSAARPATARAALNFGLALALPSTEVIAWIPLSASGAGLAEAPLRLSERLQRIAFEVVDPSGAPVSDAVVHWPMPLQEGLLGRSSTALALDAEGKALIPRRAGVTLEVRSSAGHARVVDPVDGQRVVLAPGPPR